MLFWWSGIGLDEEGHSKVKEKAGFYCENGSGILGSRQRRTRRIARHVHGKGEGMRVYEKTLRGCEVEILPMDQHGNLTIKIKPLLLGKGEPLELKVSPESALDMIGPLAVAAKDAMTGTSLPSVRNISRGAWGTRLTG